MLKYMPIYGSILLTVIIVWIIVSTFIGNRRKIGSALTGRPADNPVDVLIRAGVLDEDDPDVQAWRNYCDDPVGPEPTPIPHYSRRLPAPRPSAASGPDAEGQFGVRPTEVTSEEALQLRDDYREQHVDISRLWDSPEGRQAIGNAALSVAIADEGEPLTIPPQPNIGGEDHPEYQGPHYIVPHDRFVPYDVLRDPPVGAAVHIVGNAACVGPLEVEEDRGHATLDSSREDENES